MARKKQPAAPSSSDSQTEQKSSGDPYTDFANQLGAKGLQMREIPGDGNCLFRALGDQLEGHGRHHLRHRKDVIEYMIQHRADFEPFVEGDLSFDQHLSLLRRPGTFAGNDSIVAFARMHDVTVVIHQLQQPCWTVGEGRRQLHISFHNGDHYNSVRRVGDFSENPPTVRMNLDGASTAPRAPRKGKASSPAKAHHDFSVHHEDEAEDLARALALSQASHPAALEETLKVVAAATRCKDEKLMRECLEDAGYNADAAIAMVLQYMAATEDATDTGLGSTQLWGDAGTGSRLFGSSGGGTGRGHQYHQQQQRGGAKPKHQALSQAHMSNRQRKEAARRDKQTPGSHQHGSGGPGYHSMTSHHSHGLGSSDEEGGVVSGLAVMKI